MSATPLIRVLVLSLLIAAPVAAQEVPSQDPLESMPIRVGPLGLSPSLLIADIGVDDNVFNSETNPQRDFTATIVPRLVARLRARRLLMTYRAASDFVYYREFSSERSINNTSDLRLDLSLGHLQPFVMGGLHNTRARLNSEVDIRAHRQGYFASAGTRVLLASRTAVAVSVRESEVEFDPGVFFEGSELARTLNSRQQTVDAALELRLTPLTLLELGTSVQEERFPGDPRRDADMFRIAPTLQFAPDALLRGTASVGYRRFRPRSSELPDYSGLYVATTIGYTLLGRTKFDWLVSRDVQYSFEENTPYYLSTGTRLTITHHLVGRFDVQGTGGRQRLEYRTTLPSEEGRIDHSDLVGGGVGIRIRDNVRLGINAEYARRTSDRLVRQYERRRVFASLEYGS